MGRLAKTYIEFIDESVRANREYIVKHELLHYMKGEDSPAIDGDKAKRDELTHEQVYELSVYSTFMEIQTALHTLEEKGEVAGWVLGKPEDKIEDIDIKELLKAASEDKVSMKVLKGDKKQVIQQLQDIIKELEGDK